MCKELFACGHAVVAMVETAPRPYKVLSYGYPPGRRFRIQSFGSAPALRIAIVLGDIEACPCLRAWAQLRRLRPAPGMVREASADKAAE